MEFIAALDPPRLDKYDDYAKYLKAFDLFLAYLVAHPNVCSSITAKRPKIPTLSSIDKTMEVLRKKSKELEKTRDSSDDSGSDEMPVKRTLFPVTQKASDPPIVSEPTQAAKAIALYEQAQKKKEQREIDGVDPSDAYRLVGKKVAKTMLRPYVSDGLAAQLIDVHGISRVPEDLDKTVKILKAKYVARDWCKLTMNDIKSSKVVDVSEPMRRPVTRDYVDTDFVALWNETGETDISE